MEFLLLIVVAGLYYIIYLTAVMYSEKIVVLPIIIYAIVFVVIGITYIFIGDSYDQLTNFNVILYMGSLFYAWMAIRNLWNRPLLLKYKNITDSSSGIVNKSEYNSVESLRINIEIAKYKGIISLIVAIVLTVLMTLKSTPQITAETRDLSISFFILSLFIIIIFAVWDLIIRVRKGAFAFVVIRPILFSFWLFILNMILSRLL
ncbi:DUF5080 domain-containing protein [Staphylococcus schweitzeri]|uniref:DUF5080 domain-containing protein n=1 Tax=Staphylococcus schweitzeri TaxID=1654388 RepID=A0A2K4AIA1_9STAP|nr:DUF5080 family protein [Staphylococcus schweitzeri]MBE2127622.1 DUF5080 family protein [Staphylococcus schweitzeri]PNZ49793.1 DUF5080 domain-containing protein [Staphylococcus schweitzeri]CDR27154.1 membrane protein [Staphylococcus schweitzeri]CDR53174.1 membrane protein [Staphylococcus schweitzeri]VEE64867.1 Uncharacterised protein [Staphylococcus schweitzeri]